MRKGPIGLAGYNSTGCACGQTETPDGGSQALVLLVGAVLVGAVIVYSVLKTEQEG